jgi:transposase
MTKYQEILRLHSQGINSRNIAASLECSRNTIRAVLARATEEGIIRPLPDEMTGRVLKQALSRKLSKSRNYNMPDLEYLHQETAKNGVTLTLLWKDRLIPRSIYVKGYKKASFVLMTTVICLAALKYLQLFVTGSIR